MKGLIKFICTLIVIIVVVMLALIILDMTKYAHNPENATAYAVITSVRNLFPENWVTFYDAWRARFLTWLNDVIDFAQERL